MKKNLIGVLRESRLLGVRTGSARFFCFLILLLSAEHAGSQPTDFERELQSFDQRAAQVRELVEASRNPVANDRFQAALRFRNDAEAAFRQGNLQNARTLLERARDLLIQAEALARGEPCGGRARERVLNRLKNQRQLLQESRRWIDDIETRDAPSTQPVNDLSFLERQIRQTQSRIEAAEDACSTGADARCSELVERARTAFEQAVRLLPEANDRLDVAVPKGFVDNRLRDARGFLDGAGKVLDQVERGLDSFSCEVANRTLDNSQNQIRLANDRLQEADSFLGRAPAGQINTVLSLLRRAAELSNLALRNAQQSIDLAGEFESRNHRVNSLREQVEEFISESGSPVAIDFQEAVQLQTDAQSRASAGRYEEALNLLSQASTRLARLLARISLDSLQVNRREILDRLQSEFEKNFSEVAGNLAERSNDRILCSQFLVQARNLAEQSANLEQAGDIEGALHSINQAQRTLNEAQNCLGLKTSRTGTLLNRLQAEYDRREPIIAELVGDSGNSAAEVLFEETRHLRDISDSQEIEGRIDAAIQTVGRALSSLGSVESLARGSAAGYESELVDQLVSEFDRRFSKVDSYVSESGDDPGAGLLEEAEQLREAAVTDSQAGRSREALASIGRAIQMLERAALVAVEAKRR